MPIQSRQYANHGTDLLSKFLTQGLESGTDQANIAAKAKADQKTNTKKLQDSVDAAYKLYGIDPSAPDAQQQLMKAMHSRGESVHLGAEGLSIGQDPMIRQQGLLQRERGDVNKLGQNVYKGYDGQLHAMETMHQLLDDPNSVDLKQLKVNVARLAEGPGQRLLQSVIQGAGGDASLANDPEKASNYLFGLANGPIQPAQKNAIRENLFKNQSVMQQELQDKEGEFKATAQGMAPDLASQGQLEPLMNSYGSSVHKSLDRLEGRRQSYMKQAGDGTKLGQPQPQFSQPSMPNSLGDKLSGFIHGLLGKSSPAQAPAQAQAPGSPASGGGGLPSSDDIAAEIARRQKAQPQGQ